MSGEPPEGMSPPRTPRMPLPTPVDLDQSVATERVPGMARADESDAPPEIRRFLSPPPPPSGEGAPASTPGAAARRRSRRTVKIPTGAAPVTAVHLVRCHGLRPTPA